MLATTGDLKNNVHKLQSCLRQIKYEGPLDMYRLTRGEPSVFLPILHHALVSEPLLCAHFKDYPLFGKNDSRFIEAVYRILRDEFNYRPVLTKDQFFSLGFVERKIILVMDVIKKASELHEQLVRRQGKVPGPFIVPPPVTNPNNKSFYELEEPSYMIHQQVEAPKPSSPPKFPAVSNQETLDGPELSFQVLTQEPEPIIIHPEQSTVIQPFHDEEMAAIMDRPSTLRSEKSHADGNIPLLYQILENQQCLAAAIEKLSTQMDRLENRVTSLSEQMESRPVDNEDTEKTLTKSVSINNIVVDPIPVHEPSLLEEQVLSIELIV